MGNAVEDGRQNALLNHLPSGVRTDNGAASTVQSKLLMVHEIPDLLTFSTLFG